MFGFWIKYQRIKYSSGTSAWKLKFLSIWNSSVHVWMVWPHSFPSATFCACISFLSNRNECKKAGWNRNQIQIVYFPTQNQHNSKSNHKLHFHRCCTFEMDGLWYDMNAPHLGYLSNCQNWTNVVVATTFLVRCACKCVYGVYVCNILWIVRLNCVHQLTICCVKLQSSCCFSCVFVCW